MPDIRGPKLKMPRGHLKMSEGGSPRTFSAGRGAFSLWTEDEGVFSENHDWRAPISDKTPNTVIWGKEKQTFFGEKYKAGKKKVP